MLREKKTRSHLQSLLSILFFQYGSVIQVDYRAMHPLLQKTRTPPQPRQSRTVDLPSFILT